MRTCIIIAALAALLPATAHGQITKLYAADSDSGFVWGFVGPASVILNHDHPFGGVLDMAIASDGRILVADSAGSLSALDPQTGAVEDLVTGICPLEICPDCLSQDIFFVPDDLVTLYVLPPGETSADSCMTFAAPVLDMLVCPSGPRRGHLIVLVSADSDTTLPYIADFERTGPTTFNELTPVVGEATEHAIDIAFRPDGRLILLDGALGLYNVGPDGGLAHFGPPHVGGGSDDTDIGSDGIIYISNASMCGIYRLTVPGQIINPNLATGYGCPTAIVALGFTPTPPGTNVQVNPAEPVELRLESVPDGGFSSAVLTESASRVSPGGCALPNYAALPVGETEFTYIDLSTTAAYEDLIQADVLLAGARLFAAQADAARDGFDDVTVEGSIEDARGVISRFDEIVLVVDNRPPGDVADYKFGRLFDILEPVGGEPPGLTAVRAQLAVYADQALAYYGSYLYDWAIDELSAMNGVIRGHAGNEIPNSPVDPLGNLAGEMLVRSKTLMYTLSFLEPPTGVPAPDANVSSCSLSCVSPARGECRFELAGAAGARVAVALYDVSGRQVKALFDGVLGDGQMTLVWDGTDSGGRRVASGIYLTRVESDGSRAAGKVVFIR